MMAVAFAERRRQLPLVLAQIDTRAAANGAFHSSGRLQTLQTAYAQELEIRATAIWTSIVRVHQVMGSPITPNLRGDLESLLVGSLDVAYTELKQEFAERIRTTALGIPLTLEDALQESREKHLAEVDLYVAALEARERKGSDGERAMTAAPAYNFYGPVGVVQTGAQSVANVVQTLGEEERAAIVDALVQVRLALKNNGADFANRSDLLGIVDECIADVQLSSPNNSKLRALFDVLASSVQAIASAQPAYAALKMALAPLGIILP